MSFNENVRIDSSRGQNRTGGMGRGPKIAIGGGGGLIVLLIALFTGMDPAFLNSILGQEQSAQQQQGSSEGFDHCQTGADANEHVECRILATMESLDEFWGPYAQDVNLSFREPGLVIFSDYVTTDGCGSASSAVGPFYCPADETAYFDPTFFDTLRQQFDTTAGPLAQQYVVAHEYGHHIQQRTGVLQYSQRGGTGPTSPAVRLELQADCYAGMWAHHAATVEDPDTGTPYLKPITEEQLRDALSAAEAIGDDQIQERAGGRVIPENFTHGTSEQRMKWFYTGYEHGSMDRCDTLNIQGSQL